MECKNFEIKINNQFIDDLLELEKLTNFSKNLKHILVYHPSMEYLASKIIKNYEVFNLPVMWDRFDDSTPNIRFLPLIKNKNITFLLNCLDLNIMIDQLILLQSLLNEGVKNCNIFIPYYAVATMERSDKPGVVPSANCLAKIISGFITGKIEIYLFDVHSIVERYYFNDKVILNYVTGLDLLFNKISFNSFPSNEKSKIDCVCFPDDGAYKRFYSFFPSSVPMIICKKIRKGDDRIIDVSNILNTKRTEFNSILIVDDIIRTGNTLIECAKVIKEKFKCPLYIYTTHSLLNESTVCKFTNELFVKIFITNSTQPSITYPEHFEILCINELIGNNLGFKKRDANIKEIFVGSSNIRKLYGTYLFYFSMCENFKIKYNFIESSNNQLMSKKSIEQNIIKRIEYSKNINADIKIFFQNGIENSYDICMCKIFTNNHTLSGLSDIFINPELYEMYISDVDTNGKTLGKYVEEKYGYQEDDWYYILDSSPRWFMIYQSLKNAYE
jgi:phosphoribosylpyrophosphate synthetase